MGVLSRIEFFEYLLSLKDIFQPIFINNYDILVLEEFTSIVFLELPALDEHGMIIFASFSSFICCGQYFGWGRIMDKCLLSVLSCCVSLSSQRHFACH